jgi:hypothetical protein
MLFRPYIYQDCETNNQLGDAFRILSNPDEYTGYVFEKLPKAKGQALENHIKVTDFLHRI